jgi:hypothetical protein
MVYPIVATRFDGLTLEQYPMIPTSYQQLSETVQLLTCIFDATRTIRNIHAKLESLRLQIIQQLGLQTTSMEFYVTIYTYLLFYHDKKLYIRHQIHSQMQFGIFTSHRWQPTLDRINSNNICGCIFPSSPASTGLTDIRLGHTTYTVSGPLSFMNQACNECAHADFRFTHRPTSYPNCSIITAEFRSITTFQPSQQIFAFYNDGQINNTYNCNGPNCIHTT